MSAGSGRIKKTGTIPIIVDANKELNINGDNFQNVASPTIADKIEFITNDRGDRFYSWKKESMNKQSDLDVSRSDENQSTDEINKN